MAGEGAAMKKALGERLAGRDVDATVRDVARQLWRLPGCGGTCHHRDRVRLALDASRARISAASTAARVFADLADTDPASYRELLAWLCEARRLGAVI